MTTAIDAHASQDVLHTPDGRYIVVRGRLWRASNPGLDPVIRTQAVGALMDARRAVRSALRATDTVALAEARASVDAAKRQLGERGPPWWNDGAPDLNRRMARTTEYADWFAEHTGNKGVDAAKETMP